MHNKINIYLILLSFLLSFISWADDNIYTVTSSNGAVTYSNKNKEGAIKKKLPELIIIKSHSAKESTVVALKSCKKHGGINCAVGADHDGSVICNDGFRASNEIYQFVCHQVQLKIVSVLQEGEKVEIYIRNNSSISAQNVQVVNKRDNQIIMQKKIIEPFGIGHYVLINKEHSSLSEKDFKILCDNC